MTLRHLFGGGGGGGGGKGSSGQQQQQHEAEGTGGAALLPAKPEPAELERQFESFMQEHGIEESAAEYMRSTTDAEKQWRMICVARQQEAAENKELSTETSLLTDGTWQEGAGAESTTLQQKQQQHQQLQQHGNASGTEGFFRSILGVRRGSAPKHQHQQHQDDLGSPTGYRLSPYGSRTASVVFGARPRSGGAAGVRPRSGGATRAALVSTPEEEARRSPEDWARVLLDSERMALQSINSLSISLRSSTRSWLERFFASGGLAGLIEHAISLEEKQRRNRADMELLLQVLTCVKYCLNISAGVSAISQRPELVALLAMTLHAPDPKIVSLVLQLLACLFVHGEEPYQAVLEALDFVAQAKAQRTRFEALVNALHSKGVPVELKLDVLVFINALVHQAPSLDVRVELRADLTYCGIHEALERFNSDPNFRIPVPDGSPEADTLANLEKQAHIYEAMHQSDNDELLHELENPMGDVDGTEDSEDAGQDQTGTATRANSQMINLGDPEAVFRILLITAQEYDCLPYLLTTLQLLLTFPVADVLGKVQYEALLYALARIVSGGTRVPQPVQLAAAELEQVSIPLSPNSATSRRDDDYNDDDDPDHDHDKKSGEPTSPAFPTIVPQRQPAFEDPASLTASVGALDNVALLLDWKTRVEDLTAMVHVLARTRTSKEVHDVRETVEDVLRSLRHQWRGELADCGYLPRKVDEEFAAGVAATEEEAFATQSAVADSTRPPGSSATGSAATETECAASNRQSTLQLRPSCSSRPSHASGVSDVTRPTAPMRAAESTDPRAAFGLRVTVDGGPSPLEMYLEPPAFSVTMLEIADNCKEQLRDHRREQTHLERELQRVRNKYTALRDELSSAQQENLLLRRSSAVSGPSLTSQSAGAAASNSATTAPTAPAAAAAAAPPPPPLAGAPRPPPLTGGPRPPPLPGAPQPPPLPGGAAMPPPLPGGMGHPPPLPGMGRGPPPLPGMAGGLGGAGRPKKVSVKPSVPMRSLFWSKVPENKLESTIWKDLTDDSVVDLDRSALEQLFCKRKVQPKTGDGADGGGDGDGSHSTGGGRGGGGGTKPKQVNLLDPKTLQNVGILIAKLRMRPAEVRDAVLTMDESRLDLDALQQLHAQAPSTDDVGTLREYASGGGDKSVLGPVEGFFYELIEIPHYAPRLECFIYKLKYDGAMDGLRSSLDLVNEAIEALESCTKFHKLLEFALALGNMLNGGTTRGGLYGFRLDALQKLATIKSVDNKITLVHFMAQWCETSHPELLDMPDELEVVSRARNVPLQQWQADFAAFSKGLKQVQDLVETLDTGDAPTSRFAEFMHPFVEGARDGMAGLQRDSEETKRKAEALVARHGEDPSKMPLEEFFALVDNFAKSLAKAHADNERKREMEMKAKRRKEQEEQRKKLLAERQAAGKKAESLVDSVFGNLKSMNARDIVGNLRGSRSSANRNRRRRAARNRLRSDDTGDGGSPRTSLFGRRSRKSRGAGGSGDGTEPANVSPHVSDVEGGADDMSAESQVHQMLGRLKQGSSKAIGEKEEEASANPTPTSTQSKDPSSSRRFGRRKKVTNRGSLPRPKTSKDADAQAGGGSRRSSGTTPSVRFRDVNQTVENVSETTSAAAPTPAPAPAPAPGPASASSGRKSGGGQRLRLRPGGRGGKRDSGPSQSTSSATAAKEREDSARNMSVAPRSSGHQVAGELGELMQKVQQAQAGAQSTSPQRSRQQTVTRRKSTHTRRKRS